MGKVYKGTVGAFGKRVPYEVALTSFSKCEYLKDDRETDEIVSAAMKTIVSTWTKTDSGVSGSDLYSCDIKCLVEESDVQSIGAQVSFGVCLRLDGVRYSETENEGSLFVKMSGFLVDINDPDGVFSEISSRWANGDDCFQASPSWVNPELN